MRGKADASDLMLPSIEVALVLEGVAVADPAPYGSPSIQQSTHNQVN